MIKIRGTLKDADRTMGIHKKSLAEKKNFLDWIDFSKNY